MVESHRWCNGERAHSKGDISWVRAPIGSTQNYKIGICCFSAKHTPLGRKNTDWLARNKHSVSEWGDMSVRRLLFQ